MNVVVWRKKYIYYICFFINICGFFLLQRHPIPKNAIPCMYYKKALEDEEASRQKEKSPFPTGKEYASKK